MTQPTAITLLFDGLCPLCSREIRLLRRLDRHGRLGFVDIASPGFDPGRFGVSLENLVREMHGVLPDGRLVTGMEVFRRAWGAVGFGWLWAPTGWPLLRPLFDMLYRAFARVRPRCSAFKCEQAMRE